MSIAANFYRLIQAVQTNTLNDEQIKYLTALLEDEMESELYTEQCLAGVNDSLKG